MNFDQRIRGSLLRLRAKSPFFATLALFAQFKADESIPTAATDGRDVLFNPVFMNKLPLEQVDGVLMHELLHAALIHVPRRGARDPKNWNIAADIVVNGILDANGFKLPDGTIHDSELERYGVEEVYAILGKQAQRDLETPDLLEPDGDGSHAPAGGAPSPGTHPMRAQKAKDLERHWREALEQAAAVARGQGKEPLGVLRGLTGVGAAKLDWRTLLWRFLTRTPTDFTHFDRRFIYQGQYLEALESESVKVFVCIDTSGSVDDDQIKMFVAELLSIARAYPQAKVRVHYADAALYPGFDLESEWREPEGGGGTDFRPFFKHLETQPFEHAVAVYLTDGYGDFPHQPPSCPTLWVVSPGGLHNEHFPFGEVARLEETTPG
jgi:predicted metal-dependent peptidase